ncbi:hypothetical protein DFQ00_105260 [Paenibacillus barcinonensis]|uniref:Uncharacterized protein n=1 Tax=Paenibacillus barcinonensis TaxID=198119 RepID=A0A2V4W512_PAEBA|nr:hypothetical protein DFQ00_105260 [Paenibacillus barcinonensis]
MKRTMKKRSVFSNILRMPDLHKNIMEQKPVQLAEKSLVLDARLLSVL